MEFFCLECADVIEILDPERQIQVIHFVSVKKLQKREAKTLCQLKFYTFKISFKTQKSQYSARNPQHSIHKLSCIVKTKEGTSFCTSKNSIVTICVR